MITEYDIIHIKSIIHKRKSRLKSYIGIASRVNVNRQITQLQADIVSLERILLVISEINQ